MSDKNRKAALRQRIDKAMMGKITSLWPIALEKLTKHAETLKASGDLQLAAHIELALAIGDVGFHTILEDFYENEAIKNMH